MADRTHSHNASTPAVSAKTVPNEEFVREALEKIIATDRTGPTLYEKRWDGIEQAIGNADGECATVARAALATLSASHLAKEGGETGAVEQSVSDDMLAILIRENVDRRRPNTVAALRELAARRALPQPSPALAKGGDAVREALRNVKRLIDNLPTSQTTEDMHELIDAALSTPTEGPASQTEGMGGEPEQDYPDMEEHGLDEPLEEALREILLGGQGDDNGAQIMPDFQEGQSVPSMVHACIALLETRRDVIEGYANTEAQLRHRIAALTPPETAEAVPVASYQKNKVGSDTLFWWSLAVRDGMPNNGPLYAHPDPEAARLREELERESEESYEIGKRDGYEEAVQHIDQRTGGDGEYCCVVGYDADDRHCPDPQTMIVRIVGRFESLAGQTNSANQERDDAAKALESVTEELGLFRDFVINNATVWTPGSNHHHPIWARVADCLEGYTSPRDGEKWSLVRAATASDPAPATDDRERLVEASDKLVSIVEGIQGIEFGTFRAERNRVRLKDAKEWVEFYLALTRVHAALATEASR